MIFGIADGIGGLPGGAEAALETVPVIVRELLANPTHGVPNLGPSRWLGQRHRGGGER